MKMEFERDGVVFKYSIEGEFFSISCRHNLPHLGNAKVFAYSPKNPSDALCLGTFSKQEDTYSLKKTYPLSFFKANGIDTDNQDSVCFFVKSDDTDMNPEEENLEDQAIERAKKLVCPPYESQGKEGEALRCMNHITRCLLNYPSSAIPQIKDFDFYIIDNVKHPFNLSSIDHIICSPGFVPAFLKSGCWYLGKKDGSDILAVCICTESADTDPFDNVSDCKVTFRQNDCFCHMVGVELCEEGQYFCKLEIPFV